MFKNIDNCAIHYMGAVTMHRIGRDGITIKGSRVNENDVAVFIFGEIDVRCHIGIQRDTHKRDIEEVMDTLTDKFILSILKNKQQFIRIHLIICSITPPTDSAFNRGFPFYGTLEDRIAITKSLNNIMQNKCRLHSVGFLNIYDYYSLINGELNPAMSDGNVHIDSRYNNEIKRRLFDYIHNLETDLDAQENKDVMMLGAIHTLLIKEKYEKARIDIDYLLEKYPENSDLLNLRGEVKLHEGAIEEAKEIFSDIAKRWPNHLHALNNLAVVMFHSMELDTAIHLLERVLKIDPLCAEAKENLRHIRHTKNALSTRIAEQKKALSGDP